ncbi:MAG: DoxX family protein [Ferruginibacter sp.]
MKRLLSINYSDGAFNTAMLLLRLGAGILMMHHGYQKLVGFGAMKNSFVSFLGLGSSFSLALDIFAEFFCSMFLILGLFTRLATIPLIIAMLFALFEVHSGDYFGKGELASHYLIAYFVLLLVGPGKISVDGLIGK